MPARSHISETAKTKVVKYYTQVEYIKYIIAMTDYP